MAKSKRIDWRTEAQKERDRDDAKKRKVMLVWCRKHYPGFKWAGKAAMASVEGKISSGSNRVSTLWFDENPDGSFAVQLADGKGAYLVNGEGATQAATVKDLLSTIRHKRDKAKVELFQAKRELNTMLIVGKEPA